MRFYSRVPRLHDFCFVFFFLRVDQVRSPLDPRKSLIDDSRDYLRATYVLPTNAPQEKELSGFSRLLA